MEKSKSLRALKISCDVNNDKNPLDELFNVLNPTFKIGKPRYVERDLPDSFFNPKPRTFNPKREEAIRKEQIRHFQSLRRTRNPSSDKDKTKIEKTTDKACHKRSSSAPSLGKEKRIINISSGGTLKRKIPQARKAHFDSTTNNKTPPMEEKRTHGLSFKRANFSLDRIPLPQEWEQIDMEIDGNLERIYQNGRTGYKTRTDPRISIKTHLEDLHVSLTAEMISRINNPTAFNQNGDGQAPDLDLPNGTRWHQTEKGEVFFINDMARTTSWIHPRVEHQLIKEKLPPLNSRPKSPAPMEQKVVKTVVKNSVQKNNQVVVEKISHIKQHSIDSGVGSQMGSSHGIIPSGSLNALRTRPVSLSNSQKIQHVRSISENALLTSPQFSIYEKDFTGIREDSLSPESTYSDVQSPLSIQSCVTSPGTSVSPMDTTMSPNAPIFGDNTFERSDDFGTETYLNCTDQSFQSLSMSNEFSFDSTRQSHHSTPNLKEYSIKQNQRNSKPKFSVSSSNIFAAANLHPIGQPSQPMTNKMELTEINIEPRTLHSETSHGLTVHDVPPTNQMNESYDQANESIEMDLNEVDNIFEHLTSSDFEMHNDTFIMSLLNDADLLRD